MKKIIEEINYSVVVRTILNIYTTLAMVCTAITPNFTEEKIPLFWKLFFLAIYLFIFHIAGSIIRLAWTRTVVQVSTIALILWIGAAIWLVLTLLSK